MQSAPIANRNTMATKTSFNMQEANTNCFSHNERAIHCANSIAGTENNELWNNTKSASALMKKYFVKAQKAYTVRTRQRLQKNIKKIVEAVVVIRDDTHLDSLIKLSKRIEKIYELRPIQIAIHRDEGHYETIKGKKLFHPNHHAHIVFFNLNEYGLTIRRRLKIRDMKKLQDLTAKTLNMERGEKGSPNRHLSPAQYKDRLNLIKEIESLKTLIKSQKQEIKELKKEIENRDTVKEDVSI